MSFSNKLEKAIYEIIAQEKKELLNNSDVLDNNTSDKSLLQKAVNKLISKINESRTWEERYILSEQLDELNQINTLLSKINKEKTTLLTKKEIQRIVIWLETQINLKENRLTDDYNRLESLNEQNTNNMDDTIDIFTTNSIRDLVENSIDIKWIRESIWTEKYQDFFDDVTIIYIDFIQSLINTKLTEYHIDTLRNNKWLFLNESEINTFKYLLIEKLDKKYANLIFKMDIKKGNFEKTAELDMWKRLENKDQIKHKITLPNDLNEITLPNDLNEITNKRMLKVVQVLEKNDFKETLKETILQLKGKTIYLNNKKVKLTSDFIENNFDSLVYNLKTLALAIIHIESSWNHLSENTISSAKWLWQWLTYNWKKLPAYHYNDKNNWNRDTEYNKPIEWREPKRITYRWNKSSFQQRMSNIVEWYKNNPILWKLKFIPKKFNKEHSTKQTPLDLNIKEQVQLLILDLSVNPKKVDWKTSKVYLGWAILWNNWSMRKLYEIFHHTKPDEATKKRASKIFNKYNILNITK